MVGLQHSGTHEMVRLPEWTLRRIDSTATSLHSITTGVDEPSTASGSRTLRVQQDRLDARQKHGPFLKVRRRRRPQLLGIRLLLMGQALPLQVPVQSQERLKLVQTLRSVGTVL